MSWWLVSLMAFACEYVDSTLGMGYGTTLTPLLLLMGYKPLEIVPVILLSELVTGLLAGVFHHSQGNVNFRPNGWPSEGWSGLIRPRDYWRSLRKALPMDLKVALLLGGCSMIGAVASVILAVNIPGRWLKLYIGALVLCMGLLVLVMRKRRLAFSVRRLTILGLIASFNKGLSGGGYGPVVTAGQLLCGVQGRNAVAITSLAEGLTCLVGLIAYLVAGNDPTGWKLVPAIMLGAVLSVPLSARSVRRIRTDLLTLAIAGLTIVLGILTLVQTLTAG